MTEEPGTELVTVHGYGLWRFGILSVLCFGLCLYLTRRLLQFQLRSLWSRPVKRKLDRRVILLSSTLLGVTAGSLGFGNIGPTLFAVSFFATLVSATKKEPKLVSVTRNLEFLELSRFFWAGWLLPLVVTTESAYFTEFWCNLLGLLVGSLAAFLVGVSKTKSGARQFGIRPLDEAWARSFDLGCWEVLGLTVILGMSMLVGSSHFFGTLVVVGAFGWGRVAQSTLLRLILWMSTGYGTRGSTFRILTGVWFLLPVVVGPFLEGFDQTALMIWLTGLVPLTNAGRPWGSNRDSLYSPSDTLDKNIRTETLVPRKELKGLTPRQQAAVLFMSLPPEMSAQLFSELGPEEVQAITLEITQLPVVSPELRCSVIANFLDSVSPFYDEALDHTDQLERLVKERPTKVAEMLKARYLGAFVPAPKKINIDRGLIKELNPIQRAAILFMSLPPELAAQLFSELTPEEVQAITLEITQLPSISPEVRETVIAQYLNSSAKFYEEGNYPNLELEKLVKERPTKSAEMLRERFLREHSPPKKRRRKKKKHICAECEATFNHGIGLRKHQRQTGHKGSRILEVK